MKNYIYNRFAAILLFAFVFVSCDNYLDVQPKGIQLLTTLSDYNEWLNSPDIESYLPDELNLLGDNVDDPTVTNPPTSTDDRVYTWQEQFSEDASTSPIIWANYYASIYYYNTVLEGIDEAEGTDEERESLKAEALIGRAFDYLYLVNLYGKVYDETTAGEDLAVPFVTSNDLNEETPNRSTVQEIYDHIIADITDAIPNLPSDNSENRFRGSIAAAYSILARTYLYMRNYTEAGNNAQLALDNGPDTILDYSTSSIYDISKLLVRPDAIYARFNTNYYNQFTPSLSFLQSFDKTDLRLQFYYKNLGDYSFTTRGETVYNPAGSSYIAFPNWGTSVSEMRLILAEVAARDNDLTKACDELDIVRKCRFLAADYVKFEATGHTQEEVLQKVLDERSFELAFNGMRWFDMRRLDAEGRMSTIYRYDGSGNIVSTLSAGSNKYALQIPLQVMQFNPDWEQNPSE